MSPPELDELTPHIYASGSADASEEFENLYKPGGAS